MRRPRILFTSYPHPALRVGWAPDRNWQLIRVSRSVARRWFGHRDWPL